MLQINTFHYSPEDVDCTRCAKYGGKKRGCTVKACPWLAERIEAGVVGYEEAVRDTFPHDAHLDARLRTVVHRFTGSLFLTPAHERRMERITQHPNYRFLADADKKNTFDITRFLSTRLKPKPSEVYDVYEVDVSEEDDTAAPE